MVSTPLRQIDGQVPPSLRRLINRSSMGGTITGPSLPWAFTFAARTVEVFWTFIWCSVHSQLIGLSK